MHMSCMKLKDCHIHNNFHVLPWLSVALKMYFLFERWGGGEWETNREKEKDRKREISLPSADYSPNAYNNWG